MELVVTLNSSPKLQAGMKRFKPGLVCLTGDDGVREAILDGIVH